MAPTPPPAPAVPGLAHGTRSTAMVVLVVVASVLVPFALATVWLHVQLLETRAFVGTAGRLADDPAIQREVSGRVSRDLITALDAEVRSRGALPSDPSRLAGPLAVGADSAIRSTAHELVASDRFRALWETAVRAAHDDVATVARGRTVDGRKTNDGRVAINLDPVVDAVVAQLPGPVSTLIPATSTGDGIVLVRPGELASARSALRLLDRLVGVLPLLSVGLFAAAVVVAPRRRRALVWVGGGLAVSSTVAVTGIAFARSRYLDASSVSLSRAAAAAVFDTVLDPLRTTLWITAGSGVLLAATALITGFARHRPVVPDGDGEPEGERSGAPTGAIAVSEPRIPSPTPVDAAAAAAPAAPGAPADPPRPPGRRSVPT